MEGVCDVCRLLKGDKTVKSVEYCSFCDSNICADCRPKFHWRAVAAIKKYRGDNAE